MTRGVAWGLAGVAVVLMAFGVLADHGPVVLVATAVAAAAGWPLLGFTRAAFALLLAVSIVRTGFMTGPELPTVVWVALQAGLLLVFAVGAYREGRPGLDRRVRLILATWAAFIVAALLSVPFSPDPRYALEQVAPLAVISVLLAAIYVVRWRHGSFVIPDLQVLLGVLTLAVLWGIVGFFAGGWWASSGFGRMSGLTVNANYAGEIAALAVPLALALPFPGRTTRQRMALRASVVVLLVGGVFLSGSRGAVLSAVLGGTVALWLTRELPVRQRWAAQAALLVLLFLAVAPSLGVDLPTVDPGRDGAPPATSGEESGFERSSVGDDPLSGRGELYRELLDRFADHPLTGSGFGTTPLYNDLEQQGHNLYLSLLAETGLLGFLTFAAFGAALVFASGFPKTPSLVFGAAVAAMLSQLTETSLFGFGSPSALATWAVVLGAAHLGRAQEPADSVNA